MKITISGANIIRRNWDYSTSKVDTKQLTIEDDVKGVVCITIGKEQALIAPEELLPIIKMFITPTPKGLDKK